MLAGIQVWRRLARYNIGQLLGRMRNEILEIDPAEDITSADVRLLVERYYKPGARAIARLHSIACREQLGHYGLIEDIMNEAWTCAKSSKRALTDEIVIATAKATLKTLETRKDMYK